MFGLITEELSNKAISKRLNISPHTVKSHLRNIMEKLGVRTRLQIAAFAHRTSPASMIEEATDRRDERAPHFETIPGRGRPSIRRYYTVN